MSAAVLMVQGTASGVGKSLLVAGLCRVLRQAGYRVAPFKAQNMALNAAVTADGLEIGRAQAVQAAAAGVAPSVDMNPVLLKPEGEARSQVVVLGRSTGSLAARDYYRRKPELWSVVTGALDRLRAQFDVVVAEGAGSPAEVNLRATDIANMRVARYAAAPVLLVGDIDRGGVLASLVGTLELLDPDERALIRGLVVNKFRGDRILLESGLEFLEQRTGKRVLGVLPYLDNLHIAEEDSLGLEHPSPERPHALLDIAVLRLPRIANFDDFDLLAGEPAVRLRYVEGREQLGTPDLVILPGSKATMADLEFLRRTGLADGIISLSGQGTPVLGICGGYQMLGMSLEDPHRVESEQEFTEGLRLLPVRTTISTRKRTARVQARARSGAGWLAHLEGREFEAYEIHMGRTEGQDDAVFSLMAEDGHERADGCVNERGSVLGTYLHGIFEHEAVRHALVRWLGERRGLCVPLSSGLSREAEYERLAAAVRTSLDMEFVHNLLRSAGP